MATAVQPARNVQQMIKGERRMFAASDDSAMMKQIQATHSPDGREVDAKPILSVIVEILNRATPHDGGSVKATHEHITDVDKVTQVGFDAILEEASAYIIHKISCELACKCSGGADAHATAMAILNQLASYKWEDKVVISLAAFAVNYGEFWLVAQLYPTNPLAKAVALLKQLPDIFEHANSLKSRFDAIKNLIKAMLNVTTCIVEFTELPSQYISYETPPMSTALAHCPTAAYWTIRGMVACASQVTSLLGMSYEHITATTEAWELSSLAHKVINIHDHLKTQLAICHQYIDEKIHDEYFHMLKRLFETTQLDNMKILKALIYSKDDIMPLVDGSTKTRVNIEILKKKTVLLLISDLDLSNEELAILTSIYHEARTTRQEIRYEVVWLPILDRSMPWNEANNHKFEELQNMMSWFTIHHPSLIEPAVTKYIKEVWHFGKKMMLVVLDPQGKVTCQNALHMVWIWGNLAYPFNSIKEEALWRDETWKLDLLVDGIDPAILEWITQGKFICLYGGEDIDWIRNFTTAAKSVAQTLAISLEMIYVGKNSSKEKVRKIITTITAEKLSHSWSDLTYIWYFWARLESMLFSKMQTGKTVENDPIMPEVMTMLSFDGSDKGWAVISRGSAEMAKAKADTVLKSLTEFGEWEENAREKGFVQALIDHLHELHTPLHCNRLILPGISGGIPELVVCAECGKPMEKYFMYRCCND